jgi:hypothetical protein
MSLIKYTHKSFARLMSKIRRDNLTTGSSKVIKIKVLHKLTANRSSETQPISLVDEYKIALIAAANDRHALVAFL